MASAKPYIGCKIGLISKAQNRYEGILYTIDKINSTVVLAKVKCFGTEGRPTDRPLPPKNEVYEYITFRGSDIKDIGLCEPAAYHHSSLPSDPAIIHSSSAIPSNVSSMLGPLSPMKMPMSNPLVASSLLNHQYASAIGPLLQDMHIRRGPMVEKAVQTMQMESSRPVRGLASSQEQQWDRRQLQRPRYETYQNRRDVDVRMRSGPAFTTSRQESLRQNIENRPPPSRRQGTRRRSHGRGQLMMNSIPSPVLKFDTDFDFDSSNAQFIKEEMERKNMSIKDGNYELDRNAKEGTHLTAEEDPCGPKRYYDKSKSFFDNIPSDNGLRLRWAEERKRNLETFGVPGVPFRGQSFRGGYGGRRGQGSSQASSSARGGHM
uniref:LSM family member 14B n=1 Tax=Oryzias sinensis TaxID=183150 RepID=A0A8C7XBL5_9TELE